MMIKLTQGKIILKKILWIGDQDQPNKLNQSIIKVQLILQQEDKVMKNLGVQIINKEKREIKEKEKIKTKIKIRKKTRKKRF